jgi:hypothetical protein
VPTIAIRLEPERLSNPDLDIRYRLGDFLAERTGGLVTTSHAYDDTPSGAMIVLLDA